MSAEWKWGDVAMVTQRGNGNLERRSIRHKDGCWLSGTVELNDHEVASVRPLVVIDPDDPTQVARLADAFCSARWSHQPDSEECDPLTRSSMREALRVYLAGPKPDEPTGLGAVIEDANGLLWLRTDMCRGRGANSWSSEDGSHDYAAIAAVRVLSEGVTP